MCRVLSYLGQPIVLADLLYKPDSSLIKQTYSPKLMSHILNLAGFGMAAWVKYSYHEAIPYVYKSAALPFFDNNLRRLSLKMQAACLLAHIRGVNYENELVVEQNVHPFLFDNITLTLAHNGELAAFKEIKYDLLDFIRPEFAKQIHGTTDSEWIYALFISQFTHPHAEHSEKEIIEAITQTFIILNEIRAKHGIKTTSPVNLFITNGKCCVATRYVFDYGCNLNTANQAHLAYHSLWYTLGTEYTCIDGVYQMSQSGENTSIIIASEPLTVNTISWHEVPEYSLIAASYEQNQLMIKIQDLVI